MSANYLLYYAVIGKDRHGLPIAHSLPATASASASASAIATHELRRCAVILRLPQAGQGRRTVKAGRRELGAKGAKERERFVRYALGLLVRQTQVESRG